MTSRRYLQFVQLGHHVSPEKLMGKNGDPAGMDRKVPAPHVSHVAAVRPTAELYDPSVLHAKPWQVVDWDTLLNEVGQQSAQTVAPVPDENLPAAQVEQ